jgi:hypothetical protein
MNFKLKNSKYLNQYFKIHIYVHKGKVFPVLNYLTTTPWRHMQEWRYNSTSPDLGTRWRLVISFTPLPLYPRRKSPGTHRIGGWVGLRAGLNASEINNRARWSNHKLLDLCSGDAWMNVGWKTCYLKFTWSSSVPQSNARIMNQPGKAVSLQILQLIVHQSSPVSFFISRDIRAPENLPQQRAN